MSCVFLAAVLSFLIGFPTVTARRKKKKKKVRVVIGVFFHLWAVAARTLCSKTRHAGVARRLFPLAAAVKIW